MTANEKNKIENNKNMFSNFNSKKVLFRIVITK
jgi:hypothetical protein